MSTRIRSLPGYLETHGIRAPEPPAIRPILRAKPLATYALRNGQSVPNRKNLEKTKPVGARTRRKTQQKLEEKVRARKPQSDAASPFPQPESGTTSPVSSPPPRKRPSKKQPNPNVPSNGVFSEDEDDNRTPLPPPSSSSKSAASSKPPSLPDTEKKVTSTEQLTKIRNVLGKYISESTFVGASVPLCVICFTWFIASDYKSVYNFQSDYLKKVFGGIDSNTVGKNLKNVRPFFEGCFGILVASGFYVGSGTKLVDKAMELSARYDMLGETKIVMLLLLFAWVVSEMIGLSFLWALATLLGAPFLKFLGSGFLTYADYYFRLYGKGIPLATVCTNTDTQFDTIFMPHLQNLTREFLNIPPNVSETEAGFFRTLVRFMQHLSATRNPFSAFSRALFHTGAEETIDTVANATILNDYFNTNLFTDCNPEMTGWANASTVDTIPACVGNSLKYQAAVPHAQEMCMINGAFGGSVSIAGITQQLLLMGGAMALFPYGAKLVCDLFKWTYGLFTRLVTQALQKYIKLPPFIEKCFGLLWTALVAWFNYYIVTNAFAVKEGLVAQLSGYFSGDGVLDTLVDAAQQMLADTGSYAIGKLAEILPVSEIVTINATAGDTMYAAIILLCMTAFSKLVYHFLRGMATTTKSYTNKTLTRLQNVTSARLIKRFKVSTASCVRAPLLALL